MPSRPFASLAWARVCAGPTLLVSCGGLLFWGLRDPVPERPGPYNSVFADESELPSSMASRRNEPAQRIAELEQLCRQLANHWQPRVGPRCQLRIDAPFVLLGDFTPDELEEWSDKLLLPASQAIRDRFRMRQPDRPILVFLFRDEVSYVQAAQDLFRDRDPPLFGYYRPLDRALVLNLETGGGTLLHELTHALMAFDFPQAPTWFQEGLAALHEQCRFRRAADGTLWLEGLPNWRGAVLREAERTMRWPALADLLSEPEFHRVREAENYALARVLCLSLQHRGQLVDFYQRFRAQHSQDQQGIQTLQEFFPGQSFAEIDRGLQVWFATLPEPTLPSQRAAVLTSVEAPGPAPDPASDCD